MNTEVDKEKENKICINEDEVIESRDKLNSLILSIKVPRDISNKTKSWAFKDKEALNIIVTNSVVHKNIYYSRGSDTPTQPKKYNPKGISNYRIIKVVNYLVGLKLATTSIAPRHFNTTAIKKVSSFSATADLISLFKEGIANCIKTVVEDRQCILLKNRDGVRIEYKDCDISLLSRKQLKITNAFASTVLVTHGDRILNTTMNAHFKEDFNSYGRQYVDGYSYQYIKKEERTSILIDGEDSIEIDFSCLHIRMLLDLSLMSHLVCGINDLYSLALPSEPMGDDRAVIKLTLNILLNTTSRSCAIRALNDNIRQFVHTSFATSKSAVEAVEKAFPFVFGSSGLVVQLSKDGGCLSAMLQRRESAICLDISSSLAEKGVFVGPIHDSFLCKFKDYEVVSQCIGDTYRKHMGVDRGVDVTIIYKDCICQEIV